MRVRSSRTQGPAFIGGQSPRADKDIESLNVKIGDDSIATRGAAVSTHSPFRTEGEWLEDPLARIECP